MEADDASIHSEEERLAGKGVQYIDVSFKVELRGIEPFNLANTPKEKLEDWMYDFERQLQKRDVPRSKWACALKLKIDNLEMEADDLIGDYETIYDRICYDYMNSLARKALSEKIVHGRMSLESTLS